MAFFSFSRQVLPIYDQKSRIKLGILAGAILIAAATVVYTNILVQRLSEREQKQIDLYAKAQRFIINSEVDSNTNFVFEEIINANTTIPIIFTDGTPTFWVPATWIFPRTCRKKRPWTFCTGKLPL
ncbi:hypothetical protein [Hymenobacter cellulosilyticus]|uniref:hypothetical protein n=1 Tax=Hymenobacter cellulosilyticus TaxID=2932248 RepID=UPI002880927B|nr:hypothetical protein [Hymenobacter cellulosilyticus]